MTPIGRGGPPPAGRMIEREPERLPGRPDHRPQIGIRPSLKARVSKYTVIEQPRELRIKLFEVATTAADLETAMTDWLEGDGQAFEVLDVRTEVSTCFDDVNGVIRTWLGTVLYAPDDDRAAFEQALNDWALAQQEQDLLEIHFDHTDRTYRAHIVYTN